MGTSPFCTIIDTALPGIPAPPPPSNATQPSASPATSTSFRTLRSDVRAGAIRINISNPEQSPDDTAILKNQEAKQVRDIGRLIFKTPIQHDYEAGVEARSLLPTEQLEQLDGRWAITDVGPDEIRYVKSWVDETPSSPPDLTTRGDETPSRSQAVRASIPHFLAYEREVEDKRPRHQRDRKGHLVIVTEVLALAVQISVEECVLKMTWMRGDTSLSMKDLPIALREPHEFHLKIMCRRDVRCNQWSR